MEPLSPEMHEFLMSLEVKRAQEELLKWAMRLCASGMPPGMLRGHFYKRLVEITGEA
jgi:hypothetical protein